MKAYIHAGGHQLQINTVNREKPDVAVIESAEKMMREYDIEYYVQ